MNELDGHDLEDLEEGMSGKKRVVLTTVCTVDGKVVIDGDALVMPTSRSARTG